MSDWDSNPACPDRMPSLYHLFHHHFHQPGNLKMFILPQINGGVIGSVVAAVAAADADVVSERRVVVLRDVALVEVVVSNALVDVECKRHSDPRTKVLEQKIRFNNFDLPSLTILTHNSARATLVLWTFSIPIG